MSRSRDSDRSTIVGRLRSRVRVTIAAREVASWVFLWVFLWVPMGPSDLAPLRPVFFALLQLNHQHPKKAIATGDLCIVLEVVETSAVQLDVLRCEGL